MKSKYTNKNGVKLLAAIMAFAMVLVAGFVIIGQNESYAAEPENATGVETGVPTGGVSDDGKYYISTSNTNAYEVESSEAVTFYVQNGVSLKVLVASGGSVTVKAVSAQPETGGTILAKNIAAVTVTQDGNGESIFSAVASAGNEGQYGTGSITVKGDAVSSAESTDCVIDVTDGAGFKQFYSGSMEIVPIEYQTGWSGEATINFKGGEAGINASVKSTDNQMDLENAKLLKAMKITLTEAGVIKLNSGDTSATSLDEGMLKIVKGSVTVENPGITLVAEKFSGVTTESNLTNAIVSENLTKDLKLGENKELAENQYVYNTDIPASQNGVKLGNGVSISFMQGSSFSGTITGLNDGTNEGIVKMAVEGGKSERSVIVKNNLGVLAIEAKKTGVSFETGPSGGTEVIVGSEFSVSSINSYVKFNGTTVDAVAFTDGFELQVSEFDLTGWTVIIPKDSTISLPMNGGNYSGFKVGNGEVYVFGNISGDANPAGTKNIEANSEKVYYTKGNEKNVKQFTSAGAAEYLKVPALTVANSLYVLSVAQAQGYDISTTELTLSGEVYTTANGGSLASGDEAVDITLDAYKGTITVSTAATIHVVKGTTFTVSNETILEAGTGTLKMVLEEGSELVIKDSNIMMEVTKDPKADVKVSASVSSYDNPNGSISVGYMREFVVSGNINGSAVTVYGKLTIADKAKLSSGSTMNIMNGGSLAVKGEFKVEGDINFNEGSVGVIDGTMDIGTANGGSDVTIESANVTVSESGTMKVAATNNRATEENTLIVRNSNEPYDEGVLTDDPVYLFTVEGKLDVRGTMTADQVYDKGTITINGKTGTSGVTITVFDGVTLAVGSVKGTVIVTDDNVMADAKRDYVKVSDGNKVTLSNVTGVTVTETVSSKTYTENGNSYRLYVSDMDIAGTIGAAADADVGVTIDATANKATAKTSNGKVTVSGDMVLGEKVGFTVGADAKNILISGTVTCIAKQASVTFVNGSYTEVSGTITVKTGPGDFATELEGEEYITAAAYSVLDETNGTTTYTYTTFENAVAKILDADEKTVTVYGSVYTVGNTDIPKDAVLNIEGTLSVSKDTVVIAKDGSTVTGQLIAVSGTFTSENYIDDLDVTKITGNVVSVNGNAKTWTSLDNALAIAAPGAVITVAEEVTLSSNVTIPADVTVETEYDIIVKKNKVLTVDGTLTVTKGTIDNDSASATGATDAPGKLVVGKTGAVSVVNDAPDIFTDVSGAHFGKLVGAKDYAYVTNVDYAIKAADEKLTDSKIVLVGEVDIGDVTFAKSEKMTENLRIVISATTGDCKYDTVVSGNMKLVGATLDIGTDVKYTGSVTATANGADAQVDLKDASEVVIATYIDNTSSTPIDYMLVDGNAAEGKVTIAAGTVTMGQAVASGRGAGNLTTGEELSVIVGEGAILQVLESSSITVGQTEKGKCTFTVDGTLVVKKGTVTVDGEKAIMDVNGTVTISDSADVVVKDGTLNVLGTVTVSDEVGKEGALTNKDVITVGSKPTALGAAGTIVGKLTLADGYVLVYDGTVGKVSSGSTDAESTTVTINGVKYVTIFGDDEVREILAAADIKLAGIEGFSDETEIYSDEAMTQEITGDFTVGEFDAIYFELEASTVEGLVSVGTGIQVFIDGANVGYGGQGYPLTVGTHTVDFNIETGYDGKNVVITFNGQTVQKGGQITITADMKDFSLIVTGATPAETIVVTPSEPSESDDGTGLTDYLLIVLVVLAAILVVIVAIRMLRN